MLNEPLSLARLFVLGLLEEEDRHGYELVAIAERWAIHRWAGISIGSIYHALRKITKQGLAEVNKVEREGKRPERQVVRITEKGRSECMKMIAAGLMSLEYEGREVDMALAFAHRLPPEVRVAKLRDRLGPLRDRKNQLRTFADSYDQSFKSDEPSLSTYRDLRTTNPWIYAGIRHGLARLVIEETWTEQLIEEIGSWPARSPKIVSKKS